MDKTNIEDTILQMIEPKMNEISKKFTNGEALTQEDINTLLLKSQYNHINHLDLKLNEVTADVSSLKEEFKLSEVKITARMDSFESKIELKISEAINKNMKWSIGLIAFIVTVLKLADMFLMHK